MMKKEVVKDNLWERIKKEKKERVGGHEKKRKNEDWCKSHIDEFS